jgi:GNAT superfamily N-acetyltransferase
LEVQPINIEHAAQFGTLMESIAREDEFPLYSAATFQKVAVSFIERQVIDGAPIFGAFKNNSLVGWCEISMSDLDYCKHSGLLSMGVLNGFRGRGLGTWLINKSVSAARSMGFERVELSVLETNHKARQFYGKRGFVVEGKKHLSLKVGQKYFTEILMARHISTRAL